MVRTSDVSGRGQQENIKALSRRSFVEALSDSVSEGNKTLHKGRTEKVKFSPKCSFELTQIFDGEL